MILAVESVLREVEFQTTRTAFGKRSVNTKTSGDFRAVFYMSLWHVLGLAKS
jgi:hypothetical protein